MHTVQEAMLTQRFKNLYQACDNACIVTYGQFLYEFTIGYKYMYTYFKSVG